MKVFPNLFFLFLTSPVLSPYIGGHTFYLFLFICCIDLNFIKRELSCVRNDTLTRFLIILFIMTLSTRNIILPIKICSLVLSVLYMIYTVKINCFYLYRYIIFNIGIGIAQFCLVFINFSYATLIGPTSISHYIWGVWATPTNTNFYPIAFLTRISGLSREGGFFATLIVVTLYCLLLDKRPSIEKKKKYIIFFLILGVIISLSKTTLILCLIPIIYVFKKYINSINVFLVGIIFTITLTIFFSFLYSETDIFKNAVNMSLINRFSGYFLIQYMSIKEIVFGANFFDLLIRAGGALSSVAAFLKRIGCDYCGAPYFYMKYGLLSYLFFLISCLLLRVKSYDFLLIMLFTVAVDPLTNTGFVVVSWFLVYITNSRYFTEYFYIKRMNCYRHCRGKITNLV